MWLVAAGFGAIVVGIALLAIGLFVLIGQGSTRPLS